MDLLTYSADLGTAFAYGSLIGLERQWRQRMAGLRTHALVCGGAAMFVLTARLMTSNADSSLRVAAQIVSGIGFLGGGLIFREGFTVRGLNTAATLWCSAAVGALSGLGFLTEAGVAVGGVLGANVVLRYVARKLERSTLKDITAEDVELEYILRIVCHNEDEIHLRTQLLHMVEGLEIALRTLQSEDLANGKMEIRAILVSKGRHDALLERMIGQVSLEPSVTSASWEVAAHAERD